MNTLRLWLEPDPEIPLFQDLRWEEVEVSLRDVLLGGIHPWQSIGSDGAAERLADIVNSEKHRSETLLRFGLACNIAAPGPDSRWNGSPPLVRLLNNLAEHVHFSEEEVTYPELVSLAKERLRERWNGRLAWELVWNLQRSFQAMRAFVKAKDPKIRASSYADLEALDLADLLSVEDFEGEDSLLIRFGLPRGNLRRSSFLREVTDGKGRLRLTETIRDFQLWFNAAKRPCVIPLTYSGRCQGEQVRLQPFLSTPQHRVHAAQIAEQWGTDGGKHCFSLPVDRLCEMVESEAVEIRFSSLNYTRPTAPQVPEAGLTPQGVRPFILGPYPNVNHSVNDLQRTLRHHGEAVTGRKAQLAERLARLAVRVYTDCLEELDTHFATTRYARVRSGGLTQSELFPVLEGVDLRGLVLTMYALRHMRGNVILDAAHENDAFDLLSLAQALIRREVSVEGAFLRVE